MGTECSTETSQKTHFNIKSNPRNKFSNESQWIFNIRNDKHILKLRVKIWFIRAKYTERLQRRKFLLNSAQSVKLLENPGKIQNSPVHGSVLTNVFRENTNFDFSWTVGGFRILRIPSCSRLQLILVVSRDYDALLSETTKGFHIFFLFLYCTNFIMWECLSSWG